MHLGNNKTRIAKVSYAAKSVAVVSNTATIPHGQEFNRIHIFLHLGLQRYQKNILSKKKIIFLNRKYC
jgi:CMP-2-keto-3-deoxyoctulosonic acid synthetase